VSKRGFFLVLEGGEGTGKSTNLAFIHDYLHRKGVPFSTSREPGGTVMAEKVRTLLLEKNSEPMAPLAELLLVFAARAQHLEQKILPVLQRGEWMVCDRFTDATYAYQGGGRGLDRQAIATLENLVQGNLRPDLVIVLDAPLEISKQRAESRGEKDRIESESDAFHQRVRDAYLQRAAADPSRYAVVDASRPLALVQADLASVLDALVSCWGSRE
jgi:dTMP kinase